MRGLAEPCGWWQAAQPSSLTGACSKTNGPRLSPWQLMQAGLVGLDSLDLARQEAAVRIVAIDAGHGAFGEPVTVGPLEAGPDIRVALRALRVDVDRFARHESVRAILVNGVATRATHLVFGMTAI